MSKLFVIGNGFDCAHCLATSYDEFRKYLCNIYMDSGKEDDYMPLVPAVATGPDGGDVFDMEEVARFLVHLISEAEPNGDKWSDLETSLGLLEYGEFFDMLPEELDDDGDVDYWKEACNNEDMALNLYTVVSDVKELFAEWIDNLNIQAAKEKQGFRDLIEPEDIFLTFNYTKTLEEIYGISGEFICHIHGVQGGDILFGHGNTKDYTDEYMEENTGSENLLSDLDGFLRKDTKQALKEHKLFFDSIGDQIKDVYSIGFSFADVDLIYIKEICKMLPADAVWNLNNFNPDDIPGFETKLKECGFKGKFATFSI